MQNGTSALLRRYPNQKQLVQSAAIASILYQRRVIRRQR
jgi:hypothetical protein